MGGFEIAILVAIIVVIVLAISAGRRRARRDNGDEYPWWTLGLFAVGSRAEEEAREARADARLAGDVASKAMAAPEEQATVADGAAPNDDVDRGSEVR